MFLYCCSINQKQKEKSSCTMYTMTHKHIYYWCFMNKWIFLQSIIDSFILYKSLNLLLLFYILATFLCPIIISIIVAIATINKILLMMLLLIQMMIILFFSLPFFLLYLFPFQLPFYFNNLPLQELNKSRMLLPLLYLLCINRFHLLLLLL